MGSKGKTWHQHDISDEDRFWSKVNKSGPVPANNPELGPCWIWTGGTTDGYGTIRIRRKMIKAHRYSYELAHGPIPNGLEPDHLCRIRSCVNDLHLELVTNKVNNLRGIGIAAMNARKEFCNYGHSLRDYYNHSGRRECKIYHKQRSKRYYMKKLGMSVALGCLIISMTSCAARQSTITGLPANVSQSQVQSWDSAISNLNKIATINSGLRQSVISMHGIMMPDQQPIFPSGPNYVTTLEIIGKIDQVEVAAVSFLNGVPKDWSQSTRMQIVNYMTQITGLINQLNSQGVTGIRNKDSQSQISQTVSNILALVNLTLQL